MSNGIKVSKKYGVNPTIPVCAWCGEEKNEIALLGHIGDGRKGEDFEAPRHAVLNYEPCDKCKEQWSKGVVLLEVSRTPNADGQPPIQEGAYPTGRLMVVKPEALVGDFKAGDRALVLTEDFKQMFPQNS